MTTRKDTFVKYERFKYENSSLRAAGCRCHKESEPLRAIVMHQEDMNRSLSKILVSVESKTISYNVRCTFFECTLLPCNFEQPVPPGLATFSTLGNKPTRKTARPSSTTTTARRKGGGKRAKRKRKREARTMKTKRDKSDITRREAQNEIK